MKAILCDICAKVVNTGATRWIWRRAMKKWVGRWEWIDICDTCWQKFLDWRRKEGKDDATV